MKFVSALVTAASGKVRGLVASHNRGGSYFRGKTIPVNPRTAAQVAQRTRLLSTVTRFRSTLTPTQRAGWNTFAINATRVDRLGNTIKLSGQQWYNAMNTQRLMAATATQAGSVVFATFTDAAPTVFADAQLSPITGTVYAGAATMAVSWSNADEWNVTTSPGGTGALMVYASRTQNPARNFFRGPYRFAGIVTSTLSGGSGGITLPAGFTTGGIGTAQFFYVRAINGDGRYSPRQYFRLTA